jgi:hypothetical protein
MVLDTVCGADATVFETVCDTACRVEATAVDTV